MTKTGPVKLRKLTIMVPAILLEKALEESGDGIAATVQAGLRLICSQHAYQKLSKLRGKVKFSIPLDTLRDE